MQPEQNSALSLLQFHPNGSPDHNKLSSGGQSSHRSVANLVDRKKKTKWDDKKKFGKIPEEY